MSGFLVVRISAGGYISDRNTNETVHLETRAMDKWVYCFKTLEEASHYFTHFNDDGNNAILEVGDAGEGCAIWMSEHHSDTLRDRLKTWACCYGGWPVKYLPKGA